MWRAEETYRESKAVEDVEDKDSMGRALLSAGTALVFMAACLKRAVVLFLVEQWRIWVFLVLNLILVAIFFTSTPSNFTEIQTQEPSAKKLKRENPEIVEKVDIKQQQQQQQQQQMDLDKEEEIEEEEEEEEIGLSKEELNERVEAFIVMFKKQLISDARKRAPSSYNIEYPNLNSLC